MNKIVIAALALSALSLSACSKSEDAAASAGLDSVSLQDLPSTSEMLRSASSSSSRVSTARATVSGTAPLLTSLKANYDQVFWNGLVATITGQGSATADQKNNFWGNVDGGPGGMGACRMAQGVGEAIGRMAEGGTSACYMKKIPKSATGVTITGATSGNLFTQETDDKLVKVNAAQNGGTMNVFITIFGKGTVGADVYKAQLYFCQSGTKTGVETFEINKATGAYTASSAHDEGDHVGTSTVTATLKNNGGTITFDLSKDRNSSSHFAGPWGKFKSDLTIKGTDLIYSKNFHSSSWGTGRNYSILSYSGSGLSTIRFLDGAFKDYHSDNGGHSGTHTQGVEWQDTFYAAVAASAKKDEVSEIDFSSDTFYTSVDDPTIDLSAYDCSETPGATVDMDFADAGVAAVQEECESEKFSDYDMCNSSAVQTAMGYAF